MSTTKTTELLESLSNSELDSLKNRTTDAEVAAAIDQVIFHRRWNRTTQRDVADFFDVRVGVVEHWSREGMPGQQGDWNLMDIAHWLQARDDSKASPTDPELRKWRAEKAHILRLQREELESQLIPTVPLQLALNKFFAVMRDTAKKLGDIHGPMAREIADSGVDQCERHVAIFFGDR